MRALSTFTILPDREHIWAAYLGFPSLLGLVGGKEVLPGFPLQSVISDKIWVTGRTHFKEM